MGSKYFLGSTRLAPVLGISLSKSSLKYSRMKAVSHSSELQSARTRCVSEEAMRSIFVHLPEKTEKISPFSKMALK